MFQFLLRLVRGRATDDSQEGFVYVAGEDKGPMHSAREDAVIRVAGRGPPWIVVSHEIAAVVVEKWPGRLWRVKVVDAASLADQRSRGGPPRADAKYTRAVAVRVLREEAVGTLFGPHGEAVVRVLDAASKLDRNAADMLNSSRDVRAPAAYDRVWRNWMKQQGINTEVHPELDGTLHIVRFGSPINAGLKTLHGVVFKRAQQLEGKSALISKDDEVWLGPPWDGAFRALADAALALGASVEIDPSDRDALLRAWRSWRS